MTRNLLPFTLAVLCVSAASAQETATPPKPVTDKTVTASDVVTTPISDLNLKKQEVPPLLISAVASPYSLAGMTSCKRLADAVKALDAVLGDDLDLPQVASNRLKAGKVAQSVVGNFIPFRGVIREISGATEHDRRLQAAIFAGEARRAFLKGVGQQRRCAYPARSATPAIVSQREAAIEASSANK